MWTDLIYYVHVFTLCVCVYVCVRSHVQEKTQSY